METRMPVISRILVPVDGSEISEQAIPYAIQCASTDAAVYLLRVIPDPEEISGLWGGVVATEAEVDQMSEEEARDDLNRALTRFAATANVHTEIVHGDPAGQIIQAGLRHTVDLMVIASHGRGAIGRWTFGSVADRVARESPVPVMIVCPTAGEPAPAKIGRIVVPIDGSELASHALPVATTLARQLAAPVHLVRVISPATALYPTIALSAPLSDDSYQTILNNERTAAEQQLGAVAMALLDAGVKATFQIIVGPTVEGIELALIPGDLVVLTSHGRGGIRRWLLGSVAERLIRDGKVPVVLVPSTERQAVALSLTDHAITMAPAPA